MTPGGGWHAEPPFFEDLRVGQVEARAPAVTLTGGHAALHQAILGDRLRLPLDHTLSRRVTGRDLPLAHPGLVWDVAIGQSTLLTQRVLGNLFYRGLALRRAVALGDTLHTEVEVVGLRQNRSRPGRAATGLAALRVRTLDQEDRPVLDFHRCAMLPLRDPDLLTGRDDDLDSIPSQLDLETLRGSLDGWRLGPYREAVAGPHFDDLPDRATWTIEAGDVVSSAPELARLTLNLAATHRDRGFGGADRRLVYGGHAIGVAAAQLSQALPALVTIVGWHSCDHLGPVREGDTLHSVVDLERRERLPAGGLVHLRSRLRARREGTDDDVLDWSLVAAMA